MKMLMRVYTKIKLWLLVLIFYFIISWTTDFIFFSPKDIRLIVILVIGTLILILIGSDNPYQKLLERFRFNLFFMCIIATLLMLLNYPSEDMDYSYLFIIKPLVYGVIIYVVGFNLITRLSTKGQVDTNQLESLTRREKEVFELILMSKNNKEISEKLFIAETTVKKHVQNILRKLEMDNKEDVIRQFYK